VRLSDSVLTMCVSELDLVPGPIVAVYEPLSSELCPVEHETTEAPLDGWDVAERVGKYLFFIYIS